MSTNDIDYGQHITAPDLSGLSVAIGRIEERLTNVNDTTNRVEGKIDGVAATVVQHSVKLGQVEQRLNGHDQILADRKPLRIPWTEIASVILTAGAIAFAILKP